MNYAAIKKHDIANGPRRPRLPLCLRLHPSLRRLLQPGDLGFPLRLPLHPGNGRGTAGGLGPRLHPRSLPAGRRAMEPAHQAALLPLLRSFRQRYPEKTVWCYSGYDFEQDILTGQLGPWEITQEVLSYLDVLVDGEFHQKEKDLTLRFRGSRNQRVIDVKKSLAEDQIIWWDDEFGVGAPIDPPFGRAVPVAARFSSIPGLSAYTRTRWLP